MHMQVVHTICVCAYMHVVNEYINLCKILFIAIFLYIACIHVCTAKLYA